MPLFTAATVDWKEYWNDLKADKIGLYGLAATVLVVAIGYWFS